MKSRASTGAITAKRGYSRESLSGEGGLRSRFGVVALIRRPRHLHRTALGEPNPAPSEGLARSGLSRRQRNHQAPLAALARPRTTRLKPPLLLLPVGSNRNTDVADRISRIGAGRD